MTNLILADRKDLKAALIDALEEFHLEREKQFEQDKLYTVNAVARRLGKAHATVKKLVKCGLLKTTKDGLILATSVNEYLGKQRN
jgi:hypothetical protein